MRPVGLTGWATPPVRAPLEASTRTNPLAPRAASRHREVEMAMTRFKAQGFSIAQLPNHPAAEWRRSAFHWLHLAANDRRIAVLCAREPTSNFCHVAKQGAIERHHMALANARERHACARSCGHRLL